MAVRTPEEEAEFNKAFEAENRPEDAATVASTPESAPVIEAEEKPAEEEAKTDEAAPASEVATEEKSDEETPAPAKAEVKPDLSTKTVDYEQRWKSQKGIVKAKDQKIAEAEKLLQEKEKEIERLRMLAEKAQAPVVEEQPKVDETAQKIDALEEEYLDAVLNASTPEEKKNVIKLKKQIDSLKFQQFKEAIKQETTEKVTSVISQQTEAERIKTIADASITKYPFLDNTNEDTMNVHAIRLVRATRDDFISQGMSKSEALAAAVEEVAPMFEVKPRTVAKTTKVEPEIDADKIQSTVAVKTNSAPVKIAGKPKGLQTYDDGFDSVNPFGK